MRNERTTITKPGKARKTHQRPAVEASRFRDTRFTCNLTVPAAAKLLRVSERTIHNWESGAARVPYAAYRLLRIVRGGEFVHSSWKGWAVLPPPEPSDRDETLRVDRLTA